MIHTGDKVAILLFRVDIKIPAGIIAEHGTLE
jgi:hypothetical protein